MLDDAEWFSSQTPAQLGIMKGRRVLSRRGMRALSELHDAIGEDEEDERMQTHAGKKRARPKS